MIQKLWQNKMQNRRFDFGSEKVSHQKMSFQGYTYAVKIEGHSNQNTYYYTSFQKMIRIWCND